jgi:uncharacterized protein YecT (DUF1311 family)
MPHTCRRALATAALATALLVPASAASADPVGECQALTTNQVETGQCLQTDRGAADQVLATELDALLRRADELDRVTGRPAARPAVEASQVQWQAYREANCAVPFALAAGASGAGHFQTGCMVTMARTRAAELRALAAGG